MTDPVEVRIVGATAAQLTYLAGVALGGLVLVVFLRRRTVIPLAATRTARVLRRAAQRIEDAGLDIARTTPKENTT